MRSKIGASDADTQMSYSEQDQEKCFISVYDFDIKS